MTGGACGKGVYGGGGLSHNSLSPGRKGGILKSKKQTARGNRAAESRGKSQRKKIKHPFCFGFFLFFFKSRLRNAEWQ